MPSRKWRLFCLGLSVPIIIKLWRKYIFSIITKVGQLMIYNPFRNARGVVWRLVGAKPLSEPMLEYCWFGPYQRASVRSWAKFIQFHSRKCIWKCRLRSGGRLSGPQCVKRKEQQAWPLALTIVNLGLWYDAHRYWRRILLSIRLYLIFSHFISSHNY